MIIAQISDPHITVAGDAAHFERAVGHLMRMPARPDVVLVTGDCVDGGRAAEYERFRQLLSPLTMPVYLIPGNHDSREQMLRIFGPQGALPLPGFVQYVVEEWPVRLIALDTTIPGRGAGMLCPERLSWLEQRLAEAPGRPTVIFMHHPPFETGLAVFDQIGLSGATELGVLLAGYSNVEAILAGHVHSSVTRRFHGSLALTCPSTGHQMLPDFNRTERLAVVMEPAACLVHVWREQTGLLSYASRIAETAPVTQLHDGQRWLV